MATDNIPPPPFLGPPPTLPISTVGPGSLTFVVFTYEVEKAGWTQYGVSFASWDALPLGYYRTPVNFADVPMMVYVASRRAPDGEWLPSVTAPQDSPIVQGEDCPDGYGDVPVAELNFASDVFGALDHWLSQAAGLGLSQLCAVLVVQKVPTCPDGFTWDPATETCRPNQVIPLIPPPTCPPGYHYDIQQEKCVRDNPDQPPPPPTCPPGYTWDPITETCQPSTPPPTPTPCPPFIELPDCLPPPPGSDPDQDEPGDGFTQIAYWLEIQAKYLMNLFEVIKKLQIPSAGGNGGNTDPVTCTQLTAQVKLITAALTTIASVIGASGGTGGTPIDLTPITDKLQAIADAIAKESEPTPTAPPPSDPSVDEFVQQLADDGFFAPDVAQLITG